MDRVGTPPQGGLPPAEPVAGPVVEIACDESGFSGTNLLDPATPVITHASVDLGVTGRTAGSSTGSSRPGTPWSGTGSAPPPARSSTVSVGPTRGPS